MSRTLRWTASYQEAVSTDASLALWPAETRRYCARGKPDCAIGSSQSCELSIRTTVLNPLSGELLKVIAYLHGNQEDNNTELEFAHYFVLLCDVKVLYFLLNISRYSNVKNNLMLMLRMSYRRRLRSSVPQKLRASTSCCAALRSGLWTNFLGPLC